MTPPLTMPASMIPAVLSGHKELVERSHTPGTPEFARFSQLLPEARTTTGTLFPDTPPAVNNMVASVAVMIAMQGEFDPEQIGGTTRIGILIKGKLPTVHRPLTLRLSDNGTKSK
jgi:hypothetical protein